MGLLHWWPLNGDLRDLGPNPITLTNVGNVALSNNGKTGKCATFSGSNYLTGMVSLNNTWSYGCWFKSAASSRSWEALIMLNNNGGDADMQLGFYTYPGGSRLQSTANGQYDSNISFTYNNTWTHLFASFDGSKLLTYLNGVLVSTKSITSSLLTRTRFSIGSRYSGSAWGTYFVGDICDVRIYNHALSAEEVKEISQALVLHYPLSNNGLGVQLPNEYQRVEYLESTGTQWINSGYTANDNSGIHVIWSGANTTDSVICGSKGSATNSRWYIGSTTGIYSGWNTNNDASTRPTMVINAQFDTRLNWLNDRKRITNNIESTAINSTLATQPGPAYIFSANWNGSPNYTKIGRIWLIQFSENQAIKFNGIPCYRKSDGKPGLYDTVTNTFFTNSGTEEFLLGPSIGLPSEYQQVEYLEVTDTQILDTGIKVNEYTDFDIIFNIKSASVTYPGVLSSWDGSDNYVQTRLCWYNNQNRINCVYRNNSAGYNSFAYTKGTIANIRLRGNASNGTFYNGVMSVATNTAVTTGFRNVTTTLGPGGSADIVYYCLRMYNNMTVLKDFIPCYRKIDGKPGMYDMINNVFYVNQGTGTDFLLGPSVGLPERYQQVEYIKGVSTQYISGPISFTSEPTVEAMVKLGAYDSDSYFFHCRSSSNSTLSLSYAYSGSNVSSTRYSYPTKHQACTIVDKNKISRVKSTPSTLTLDGTIFDTTQSLTSYPIIGTTTFNLFGWTSSSNYFKGQIYYVRIYEQSILHDFIPCVRNIDNKPGVFDMVNGVFYANAGTGEFLTGARMGWTHEIGMNNSSNIEYDISGFGNNGTRVGNLLSSSDTKRYKASTYWPTASSAANNIQSPVIYQSGDAITMSIWIKTTQVGGASYQMPFESDSRSYCEMSINSSGKLRGGLYVGGTRYVENVGSGLLNGNWHMISITYNGSVIKRYIDGVSVGDTSVTGKLNNTAQSYWLGVLGTDKAYYNSNIWESDARLYATALSADDIMKLYKKGRV